MSGPARYSDDDLRVIVQDWSLIDPDQSTAINLASELLDLRGRAAISRRHVDEAMVERAMRARIPGGSEAWVWLFNCEGGMTPEDKHRDWFRRILADALAGATP